MNNLTQTQVDVKEALLNEQQEQMIVLYQNAPLSERKAIIKHIDAFFENGSRKQKIFWLKFRLKLEAQNEKSKNLFPLGETVMTISAKEALAESNQLPNEFLAKHQSGDWGIIGKDDWRENDLSVKKGFRILSAYKTLRGVKIWVITEADRSSTTVLLPSEY
jgi:hypothetical protein